MPEGSSPSGVEASGLLDGLEGQARRDRAELIVWLLDHGFTADQIRASFAPLLLPANRVLGDDGICVSTRQIAESTGLDLELVQRLQRAVGLPRIDDPDAEVLPRADAEAAARTKLFVEYGLDPDEAVATIRVMMDGLRRAAAMMRQTALKLLIRPGASEVDLALSAEALAQQTVPRIGPMVEGLLLLELRQVFEIEGISAAERAAGTLPGARQVAVAFADLAGFTRLGESLPPEDLERVASGLADLAHEIVVAPVWFIKTIGDAVMLVCPEPATLVNTALDLVDLAAANGLPQLRVGVAVGPAVSRGGDWFGSPVNTASRISGVARPGTVLVADSGREAIGTAEGFTWSSVGARHLKGIRGQVRLFRVGRASHGRNAGPDAR